MVSQHAPEFEFVRLLNTTLLEPCSRYEEYATPLTAPYCPVTWDKLLCWPATPAGTVVKQNCPKRSGFDTTQFAFRRCSTEGQWEGNPTANGSNTIVGWTNYTMCLSPEMAELMHKLHNQGEMKIEIAERTRILEIVGLSVSLLTLLVSLAIFGHFRSLKNNRTRIHKNLFVAMAIQVTIRLILYIDQAIIRAANEGIIQRDGIDNTPILCQASYFLLEYARTTMFMWMFIEGLYLHNVVTVTVFQGRFPHTMYALVGWGAPFVLTVIWAVITIKYKVNQKCLWGYNLTPYYWILEGPRLAVILLNFCFLLNIIRVLVVKLRQSHTSDLEQARKAVRAALVLLPLLGITNLMNMFQAPLEKSALQFALWSYTTHFLTSFQGFFIAMLYCFLNGEVRLAIMKSLSVYLSLRGYEWRHRRQSMYSAAYATAPDTEANYNNDRANSPGPMPLSSSSRWGFSQCFRSKTSDKQHHQLQRKDTVPVIAEAISSPSPETRV